MNILALINSFVGERVVAQGGHVASRQGGLCGAKGRTIDRDERMRKMK